jgi:hypothetical protein
LTRLSLEEKNALLLGSFVNQNDDNKMLRTQRAAFLALVALDAQRGLVWITKHLASREKCVRGAPQHELADAMLPALLAALHGSSGSAPQALFSVTLLRRLTDGSRHLLGALREHAGCVGRCALGAARARDRRAHQRRVL